MGLGPVFVRLVFGQAEMDRRFHCLLFMQYLSIIILCIFLGFDFLEEMGIIRCGDVSFLWLMSASFGGRGRMGWDGDGNGMLIGMLSRPRLGLETRSEGLLSFERL
jgi:hypothetical protein